MLSAAMRVGARPLQLGCRPVFSISNWKLPAFEIDSAGISGFLEAKTSTYLSLTQKLNELRPGNLYTGFDEWTRQLVVTLSTDLGCSFGLSIMVATIIIKTIFLYPTLRGQIQGLRQAEMKQLSKRYQEKMQAANMSRNTLLQKQASYEYKMAMKKKGFSNVIPMLNLLQIPILLTWFFSLRYMSNLPEIYPQMLTQGFFWFSDLSTYDPYFLLPVAAACITSLSIIRSPNLAKKNISMPLLAPYVKYMRYLPFASLAVTTFFPASINLYWFTLAGYQLMMTEMMHMKVVRNYFFQNKKGESKKNLKFDGAVFVNQNKNSQEVMEQSQKLSERREQILKEAAARGKKVDVKEVKVSFQKIKKKKEIPE